MKKAFTLVETMLVLSILGVLFALMLPTLFSSKPDESTINYRRTFFALEEAIRGIINDSDLYPTGDLRFAANKNPTRQANEQLVSATSEKITDPRIGLIYDSYGAFSEAVTDGTIRANSSNKNGYRLCHHLANSMNTIGRIRCPGEAGLTTTKLDEANMTAANVNFKLSNGADVGGIHGNWDATGKNIILCIDTNGLGKAPDAGCAPDSRANKQRDQYRIAITYEGKVYTGKPSGANNWFMENMILINPKVLTNIKTLKKRPDQDANSLKAEQDAFEEILTGDNTNDCAKGHARFFKEITVKNSSGSNVKKCVFTAGYEK